MVRKHGEQIVRIRLSVLLLSVTLGISCLFAGLYFFSDAVYAEEETGNIDLPEETEVGKEENADEAENVVEEKTSNVLLGCPQEGDEGSGDTGTNGGQTGNPNTDPNTDPTTDPNENQSNDPYIEVIDGVSYVKVNGETITESGIVAVEGEEYYVETGIVQTNVTGLYDNGTDKLFVQGGKRTSFTGAARCINDDTIYAVTDGVFDSTVSAFRLCINDGEIYYALNGVVDEDLTGLVINGRGNKEFARNGRPDPTFSGAARCIEDGIMYAVTKGDFDSSVNAFRRSVHDNEVYYALNGVIIEDLTGLAVNGNGVKEFVRNGHPDPTFSGAARCINDGKMYAVTKGVFDRTVSAFRRSVHDNKIYYALKGVIDENLTGLAVNGNGVKEFVRNGHPDTTYSGAARCVNDGKMYAVTRGEFDKTVTAFRRSIHDNKIYYALKGVIDEKLTGLAVNGNGVKEFVRNGHPDTTYSGAARCVNDGKMYAVTRGEFDRTVTAFRRCIHDNKIYYALKGVIDENLTGVAVNGNGVREYVKNGHPDTTYTGLAKCINDGETYYVQNGVVNPRYSGLIKHGSAYYYVVDGKVPNNQMANSKNGTSTFITISISKQQLLFYQNGNLVLSTPIVTGAPGYSTPTGTFYIRTKSRNTGLSGPTWDVTVNYWMGFDGSGYYGIHDASWRNSFGGNIYSYDGSHGCVNLPYSAAELLYTRASMWTPIYISR